ncbi:MAG: hypothetical protein WBV61_09330 [Rhodanobacteraceae bacterium]
MSQRHLIASIVGTVPVLALLGVIGLALLLAAMRIEHDSDTLLPRRTGPFPVGRTSRIWIDNTHSDQPASGKPFMFLVSDHDDVTDPVERRITADVRSVYGRLSPNERLLLRIRGANHFGFSDDAALLRSRVVLRTLRALGIVSIDGRRQLAVTAYWVRSFFDAYLQQPRSSSLRISSSRYPEILVEN